MKSKVVKNGRTYEYEYPALVQFRPSVQLVEQLQEWDKTGYDRAILFRCRCKTSRVSPCVYTPLEDLRGG